MSEWIPVEEQMPETGEYVLTCDENGFITISSCNSDGEFSSFTDNHYIKHGQKLKVVAWMPLPKALKKWMEGNEE